MNKCEMLELTDKVEIAKQAIKEMLEEHQLSENKPTARQLVFRLLSQLDSLQEEVSEKLCPEVKAKEQWDSLQDEQVEKLCPEVGRTEEKPKEQLDSLQEEGVEKWCLEVAKTEDEPGKQLESLEEKDVEKWCPEVDKTAEIIKEVRNVKRQNLITHCLVSTMILLTAAWQISEVSLLFKVKNGLKNPFDFFGGIIKGLILKGVRHELDCEQSSTKQKPDIKPPLFKLPDLPLLDWHIFDSTDEE